MNSLGKYQRLMISKTVKVPLRCVCFETLLSAGVFPMQET